MEFIINKNYFNKAIASVSRVAASKFPNPILSGIKLIADESGLTLIGSNSNMLIEKLISLNDNKRNKLEILSHGSIVVSAKYLSGIVKKLPDIIHFKLFDNKIITIHSEGITTKLNGISTEEYPGQPDVSLQNSISISSQDLRESILETVFAVSLNDSMPVLMGVNMVFDGNKFVCVATNSHRLALKELEIDFSVKESIVVPQSSLKELIKLLDDETSTIHISFSDHYIVFQAVNSRLFSKLIEGNYPESTRLILKESNTVLTLDAKSFLQGIDRACVFASESRNNTIRLEINDGEQLIISSNTVEVGRIEEKQKINTITGNTELTLSLDGNFLMDAIKMIKSDEIKMSMGGSMSPVRIEPVDGSTYIHLISPVRT